MVVTTTTYDSEKHCHIIHEPSKTRIETDAPKDNQGKGESFSPTDLMGAALGACILTTMAILCEKEGLSLSGTTAHVFKEMASNPRRISKLAVKISFAQKVPTQLREKIERIAHTCPVHKSLNPEIDAPIEFVYS